MELQQIVENFTSRDNWVDLRDPLFQGTLVCPVSGEQVMGDRWKYPSLPSGRIILWHCPGCKGWHVLRLNTEIEANAQTIFSDYL